MAWVVINYATFMREIGLLYTYDHAIIMCMKRIQVLLSIPQWEALTALAKKLGLSFSETLRRAIDEFLKQQKP